MTDVRVEDHGSVFLVRPLTPGAQAWIEENVSSESWQWMGGALAVEPRYAPPLVEGMQEAGLEVETRDWLQVTGVV